MITKTVKEYGTKSKRMRIDINKSDGFNADETVAIIPIQKYNEIKQDVLDLQNELMTARAESDMAAEVNAKLTDQIQDLRNRKINLDKMIKNAVSPIDDHYQREIKKKDDKINELESQLKTLQSKINQYNLDMMALNIIDIGIRHKHKKLIQNFNESIALIGVDPTVVTADVKKISENENGPVEPQHKK